MRKQALPFEGAAADLLRAILMSCSDANLLEQHLAALQHFRAGSAAGSEQMDRLMMDELVRMRSGLEAARASQADIRATIAALTAPPYFPAVFLARTSDDVADSAVVRVGGEVRAISFGQTNPDDFLPGDDVLVSHERNFVVRKSGAIPFTCGDTAAFVRPAGENRLVVKSRDEELVVLAAAPLRDVSLKAGDLVRIDRSACVAYERVEQPRGEDYFLEETPAETFESIGGLEREIEEVKRIVELHLYHAEAAGKYRLRRKKSLLLHGPPGTGKTMTARCLANWLAGLSKSGRARFICVKPAALHSMWYSQTESNYRKIFSLAREAAAAEPGVPIAIFFDEVDSIAGIRGRSVHQIDDHVANAFMAELNGLEDRGNILVVSATNRLDALDPAFTRPGRLGDLVLRIPRPGRKAARQIFEKHLPADIPYAANGHTAARVRQEAIDAAVSMIFAANGDAALAEIMFRDGKRRPVRAGDLINGAEIAAMAQSATERACAREARGGDAGIRASDLAEAVHAFFGSAARALTPANCRNYLDDLPQDVDVVSIDPVVRKVSRPYQYVNAN